MAAKVYWIGFMLLMASTALAVTAEPEVVGNPTSVIDELDVHCRTTSILPNHVSNSCSERLGRYFESEPIWDAAVLRYKFGGRANWRGPALNDRVLRLPYTHADFLHGDVPMWGDIFDGRIEHRIDLVSRVLLDSACMALVDVGRIDVALTEQCEARELFKYAAYLDACVTGLYRVELLHTPRMPGGTSLYQKAEESTDRRPIEDDRDLPSLMKMGLLSMWLADQCSSTPLRRFDENLRPVHILDATSDHRELLAPLRPVHDSVMSIAARAGDPWAVRAFFVTRMGLSYDVDYWKSLFEFDRLLFHRWVAAYVGDVLGLTPQDRAMHAVMAFMIERRTWPERELQMDDYVERYGVPLDSINPSWREGSVPASVSSVGQHLVYPWGSIR